MVKEGRTMIGEKVTRVDGKGLATGRGRFLADIHFPNMLHAKILRSPYGHAKIRKIDVSKAKELPGVAEVLTGKDLEGVTEPYGQAGINDEFPLALDKVRFEGHEVAVVAAETENIAEDALDLIKVEYEPLPAVLDPEEAMKPGAPLLYENLEGVEGNVCDQSVVRAGDVEKGFQEADRVIKQRFVTSKPTATPLETHGSVAIYDSDDVLTLWTGTQMAHIVRFGLALVLGIPENRIVVKVPYVGGGFGHKTDLVSNEILCAVLAMRTGRPVRIVLDRKEEFQATRSRHPIIREMEVGVKNDGTITAWKEKVVLDTGACSSLGPGVIKCTQGMALGPYKMPNYWSDGYLVYTNKQPAGAFRGFGSPQAAFVREQMLDMMAKEIGITPWEIRMRNIVYPEDLPYTTCHGLQFHTLAIKECMEKAAKAVNMEQHVKEKKPYRGVGIANMIIWSSCRWNPELDTDTASAVVRMETDGSVSVFCGSCDSGQMHATMLNQVCASELGVTPDRIRVVLQDTDAAPFHLGTWGSRTAVMSGGAVALAAREVKEKILKVAGHMLEIAPEDLEMCDNKVVVKGSPDRSVSLGDIAVAVHYVRSELPEGMPADTIVGAATYDTPTEFMNEVGIGNMSIAYTNSCHIAVVDVDPQTGETTIVDYAIAEDLGRTINPEIVRGQLAGGRAQGLGYALFEDMVYADDGHLLNPTFTDYKVPTICDLPLHTKFDLVETFDPMTPLGNKSAGESGLPNVAAAIANAIHDATGIPLTELPMSPERVWAAMRSKT
jgi:CO/xanthine dehydrogenase Mo-binding subunit